MLIQKKTYAVEFNNNDSFTLFTEDGEQLFLKNHDIPFLPVTNKAVRWDVETITRSNYKGIDSIEFTMKSNHLFDAPRVILLLQDDYIEFFFKGTVKQRAVLNKWHIFQKGTDLHALEVLNFRSHIDSPDAYDMHQTLLGRRKLGAIGVTASTDDLDLMFAPHPLMFLFRNMNRHMIVAPMELVPAESMKLVMLRASTIVEEYYLNVGRNLYWLEEGENMESPHYLIMLTENEDPCDSLKEYSELLVREGRAHKKTKEDVEPWWLAPMWCSWGDQHIDLEELGLKKTALEDAAANTGETKCAHAFSTKVRDALLDRIDQYLVELVVDIIEKHDLPVKTLILDDRWYRSKNDFHADTDKFPDLRGFIDTLHAKGFKVIAWASLYRFSEDTEVFQKHPEWFIMHHYPGYELLQHVDADSVHIDYSNDEIADAFLEDMLGRLLSNKEGCYNFDGIKFDWTFLAPHEYPYDNREWCGKEKTIYNTQKKIYTKAKSIKKDALIIGVTPHPFFSDTQDIIRTYDVISFDHRIQLNRAKYVQAISPGVTAALDEHVFYENFFKSLKEGIKIGCIPMLYNLVCFHGDNYKYTDDDYKQLKSILDFYIDSTPALKNYLAGLNI